MTTADRTETGFIEAELDLPIRYMDRSRAYYLTLGYGNPYRWAQHQDVPFTRVSNAWGAICRCSTKRSPMKRRGNTRRWLMAAPLAAEEWTRCSPRSSWSRRS